jgi:hypothetical protein
VSKNHEHVCSLCGECDRSSVTFEIIAGCDCPNPGIDAICAERVPGARNLNCPSLANLGREDITRLMVLDHEIATIRRERTVRDAAAHFGVTFDRGWIVALASQEEAWQTAAYWPSSGA